MLDIGSKVVADGLICEIVDVGEDTMNVTWYAVTPVDGIARGFIREFLEEDLELVEEV